MHPNITNPNVDCHIHILCRRYGMHAYFVEAWGRFQSSRQHK